MENWKLWEKVVCVAVWSLLGLIAVAGIFGGVIYLIDNLITR